MKASTYEQNNIKKANENWATRKSRDHAPGKDNPWRDTKGFFIPSNRKGVKS